MLCLIHTKYTYSWFDLTIETQTTVNKNAWPLCEVRGFCFRLDIFLKHIYET